MKDIARQELIQLMIGTTGGVLSNTNSHRPTPANSAASVLECHQLSTVRIGDVSLRLAHGQVLGLAGTLGSGRTGTLRAIFGLDRLARGAIRIDGHNVPYASPSKSIARGIAFLPEDRRGEGILPDLSVRENLTIAILPRISRCGVVNRRHQRAIVSDFIERLKIRASSPDQPIRELSGGNQQKVLLARWLCRKPILLLADEPTRGIDVGARREIQSLLNEMADGGLAVVLVSSELSELIESATEVIVLRDGHSITHLRRDEISEANIIRFMASDVAATPTKEVASVDVPTDLPTTAAVDPPTRSTNAARIRFADWGPRYGPIVALALLLLISSFATPNFATASNFWNIALQATPSLLVAMGMTIILATGGVDLSVGSTMALASTIVVLALPFGAPFAIALALASGVAVGIINGVFSGLLAVEPFIATLAAQFAIRGLAQLITSGSQLLPFNNPWLEWLGQGRFGVVPVPSVEAAVGVITVGFMLRFTTLGRYFLAVGSNARAAYIAGVPVRLTKAIAYSLTGLLAGAAGIIETARLGAADPANVGLGMEFTAIASAVIGGTALGGGRASVSGTVAGVMILVVIGTSLNMLGMSTAWTFLLQALLILIAVAIQRARRT